MGASGCALFKSRITGLTNRKNYIMGVKSFSHQGVSDIPKKVILSVKPVLYQPVPLSELRDGLRLRREMGLYLEAERRKVDQELEKAFQQGLWPFPIGSSEITKTPGYWNKLVDACTTVGSRALDRIEKRLRIIGHGLHWEPDFDYRTLAHQLYLATDQARKLQNSYQQRRKCVRAVLKNIEENEKMDGRYKTDLGTVRGDSANFFEEWFDKAFQYFTSHSKVQPKFHDMYRKEWLSFCEDFLKVSLAKSKYEENFDKMYLEYLAQLQSRLKNGTYRFGTFARQANDIDLSEDLALNLKLNSGELIMMYEFQKPTSVNIMDLSQEIFLALMNKFHIEFLGVVPINTGNKGIRVELPKPEKTEILKDIQSTVLEIFKNYKN